MTSPQKFAFYPPGPAEPWSLPEYPELSIYVNVPEGYTPEKAWGLLFFMHGGDRNTPREAPKGYIGPEDGPLFPYISKSPFITVAPTAPIAVDGKRWNRQGVCEYVEKVIASVRERFRIDPDRMILGGHSMGGFGAYHVGSLLADRFAGVWCSAGAWLQEDFRSFLGTPVYISHGRFDCAAMYCAPHPEPRHHDWCGVDFARAAHELMLRDDVPHVYDEHAGGHGMGWEPVKESMQRFFRWAARQRRQISPSRCAVISPRGSADPDLEPRLHARWLTIDAQEPGQIQLDQIVLTGPNIAWTIDEFLAQSHYLRKSTVEGASLIAENLGGNRFVLEARNVKAFTLFLNRDMADCTRPVELILNGQSRSLKPMPSAQYPEYPWAVNGER